MGGIVETLQSAGHAVGNAVQGVEHAAGAVVQGTERAVGHAFAGTVKGVKNAIDETAHMASDVARTEQHVAAGVGKGLSDGWHGAADAVGQSAQSVADAVGDAGKAAGKAYDHVVDGAAHAVGDVAGPRAGAAVHDAAQAMAAPVRQVADFGFAATSAVGEGAGRMVRGLGDIVVGGLRVNTDAEYRDKLVAQVRQAAGAVGRAAAAAAHDPAGAARSLAHAAGGAFERFEQGGERALQNGTYAAWAGHAAGSAAFEIVTTVGLPGTKVAKAADAAGGLTRAAEGAEHMVQATGKAKAGQVAGAALDTGRAAKTGSAAQMVGMSPGAMMQRLVDLRGGLEPIDNCVLEARNLDRFMATGEDTSAAVYTPDAPFSMTRFENIEQVFGTRFERLGRKDIEKALLAEGEGARGVVLGIKSADNSGHAWNAVVHDGKVTFMDAQSGGNGLGNFDTYGDTAMGITGRVGDGVAYDVTVAQRNLHAEEWAAKQAAKAAAIAAMIALEG